MFSSKKKVAINGFGRIGRLFLKNSLGRKDFEVVAINDLGQLENLAYLLEYDTVYGRLGRDVKTEANRLVVDGFSINFFQERDPARLPWKDLTVDIAVEATGVFESYEKARVHLEAGAKRVVITAPAKDEEGLGHTVLLGVNEEMAGRVPITSNGSCTTNAASPVIAILAETIGVEKAILNTVHGYTATQSLVDGPVYPVGSGTQTKDFRRGRAAAQNIAPSTTGATIAVTRALPQLDKKFDGLALRVPTVSGSLADITFIAKRSTSAEEINRIFEEAEKEKRWQGILKTTRAPIVSSDVLGEPYGAIVDLNFTRVIDGNLVKVLSWYDNEAGYVATLIKHVELVAKLI